MPESWIQEVAFLSFLSLVPSGYNLGQDVGSTAIKAYVNVGNYANFTSLGILFSFGQLGSRSKGGSR